MKIEAFIRALGAIDSPSQLRQLTPADGLVKYLQVEQPDAKSLSAVAAAVKKIDPEEGKSVQDLFDRRFAIDGLAPDVRAGLESAADKLGVSDRQDLAYRLFPLLKYVKSADEAKTLTNSGHHLTREECEAVASVGQISSLTPIDIAALLTQASGKSSSEIEAMANAISALKR